MSAVFSDGGLVHYVDCFAFPCVLAIQNFIHIKDARLSCCREIFAVLAELHGPYRTARALCALQGVA